MNIMKYIKLTIDRLPKGYVFTYIDFVNEVDQKEATIKALNRLVASGKIAKLSKGKYYKPEYSPFGILEPNQKQIVKDLLEDKGKIIGYLTGYSIYNQLGLTSQVSSIIQIGKNQIRPNFKRNQYKILFIKQKNIIRKDNITLLQILDTIRFIKKIPAANINDSCKIILGILAKLSDKEISNTVRLALNYPPSTRALLGALLEQLNFNQFTDILFKSLNPITKYKFSSIEKLLFNTSKWNIK